MKAISLDNHKFDIAVIGGGPAGIMAAIRAGECGARVILIEANQELGKKLLLTGGGRCNVTQANLSAKDFGNQGAFLFSALKKFGISETINFFKDRGLPLEKEGNGRMFPLNNTAKEVLSVLVCCLDQQKVVVSFGTKVEKIEFQDNKITSLFSTSGKIEAQKYIICTGGKSYPKTGSSGDGYKFARQLGHTVNAPAPALTPVKTKEEWVRKLQGLCLDQVGLTIIETNGRHKKEVGDLIFTHFGLSGPLILNASKDIGQYLRSGPVILALDLMPGLSLEEVDAKLAFCLHKNPKKKIVSAIDFFPQKLVHIFVDLAGLKPEKKSAEIKKEERRKIATMIKGLNVAVAGLMGFSWAMVTNGGISLKEIDGRTMRSKFIENLYFAGEVVDLDGPTGGYNLQMCWSTGYLAGQGAAEENKKR